MHLPKQVKIVEVSPRDGLQNEPKLVPAEIKIAFINKLSDTGLKVIECTSFVSPRWVPQLADGALVLQGIHKKPEIFYPVLVPNETGFNHAVEAGAKHIAVFTAATETFCQKNTHCSLFESLEHCAKVISLARKHHIAVRGYISCVLDCPYEGRVAPERVAMIAEKLWILGCTEISLGDTLGKGTPERAQLLVKTVSRKIPLSALAAHFHDTYGQALANLLAVMECGIAIIDSSVQGLGGCPYAKGASGNVATEDVLFMLDGLGIKTGVDMPLLLAAGRFIMAYLQRSTFSKVALAMSKT